MPGLYTHITRATGTILTASIYNSDHQNHIDNEIPAMIDDYSASVAEMKLQTDPGESGSESLSTNLAGEIERLRFALAELKGTTWWYQTPGATAFARTGQSNTFTATNTFQAQVTIDLLATIGTGILVTGADNGAGGGPNAVLKRTSTSPAVNDNGAQLVWQMNDSGGGVDNMVLITTTLLDPTAGSEDAALAIFNMQAGVLTNALSIGPGLAVGAPTGSYKGQGTLNGKGVYTDGHGTIAQSITTSTVADISSATTIPADDTPPQSTEGVSVGIDTAITPTNASSIIEITVAVLLGAASETTGCLALFKDAGASAIAATFPHVRNSTEAVIVYKESAVNTSLRTYKARAGLNSGTVQINGNGSGRLGGGVTVSSMTVREILPQ